MANYEYKTIKQLIEGSSYPFTLGQLRHYLTHRHRNGLEEAIQKLNLPLIHFQRLNTSLVRKAEPKLEIAKEPSQKWKEKALQFIHRCHDNALQDPAIVQKFYERGFNDETIKGFKLGYCCNPVTDATKDMFCDYAEWGLEPEIKEVGKSPGDALKDHKIDLREWILQGLPEVLKPQ